MNLTLAFVLISDSLYLSRISISILVKSTQNRISGTDPIPTSCQHECGTKSDEFAQLNYQCMTWQQNRQSLDSKTRCKPICQKSIPRDCHEIESGSHMRGRVEETIYIYYYKARQRRVMQHPSLAKKHNYLFGLFPIFTISVLYLKNKKIKKSQL